jgi:hypothetical protein
MASKGGSGSGLEPNDDVPRSASGMNHSRESFVISAPPSHSLIRNEVSIFGVGHQHHIAPNVAIDLCGFVGSKFNALVEVVSHLASKEYFCEKVRSNLATFRAAGNAHVPASARVFHNTAARFILSVVVAATASRLRTLRAGLAARLSRSLPAISAHNAAARKSFWFGGTEESGRCRWTLAASALFLHIFRAQEGATRARRGGSFAAVALTVFAMAVSVISSGCAGAKSAWKSYDRSVSRDIAIGASQDRGGFATYTIHLGPQSARREPDFKQPVEAMKGVIW